MHAWVWQTLIKSPQLWRKWTLSPSSHQLLTDSQLEKRCCDPFPTKNWNDDCLDLGQATIAMVSLKVQPSRQKTMFHLSPSLPLTLTISVPFPWFSMVEFWGKKVQYRRIFIYLSFIYYLFIYLHVCIVSICMCICSYVCGSSLIHFIFILWGFSVESGAHPLVILIGQWAPGICFSPFLPVLRLQT